MTGRHFIEICPARSGIGKRWIPAYFDRGRLSQARNDTQRYVFIMIGELVPESCMKIYEKLVYD